MRLIDPTKLPYRLGVDGNDRQIIYVTSKDIDNAPTVEFTQCKDCKYWDSICETWGGCGNPRFAIPGTVDPTMDAGDFCSLGEKRDDNGQV